MHHVIRPVLGLLVALLLGACTANRMSEVTTQSVEVLREFAAAGAIPAGALSEAKAVAILREGEGAAVVGFSGGEGVLVRRLDGGWSSPLAIEASSASVGLQIGGQQKDVVLLFQSTGAIDRLLASGAYAVGRAEGTFLDAQGRPSPQSPEQDVVPIVRTGGVFGGVSIAGLSFKASEKLNRRAYGDDWSVRGILSGSAQAPAGSWSLWRELDRIAAAAPLGDGGSGATAEEAK
jgi:lipid-binding SYLF domain-containing protein